MCTFSLLKKPIELCKKVGSHLRTITALRRELALTRGKCRFFQVCVCYLTTTLLLGCSLLAGGRAITPDEDPIPSDAHKYFLVGVEHTIEGRYQQAIAEFDKVLQLNSGDGYAYLGRGQSNLSLKRYFEAIVDFEKAISLLPEEAHGLVWLNVGFAQYLGGNITGGIATLDQVINSHPEDNWNAHLYRGIAKHDLGQFRAAISDYTEYVRERPDEGYPYFLRGLSKYGLGCLEATLADFDHANFLLPQLDDIIAMQEEILALLDFSDSSPQNCQNF